MMLDIEEGREKEGRKERKKARERERDKEKVFISKEK